MLCALVAARGTPLRPIHSVSGHARCGVGVCTDECCAPPPLICGGQPGERQALIREAFRLEWLTVGWMTVEAIVALGAGVMAGSLVLDSLWPR